MTTKDQILTYFDDLYDLNEEQTLYLKVHGKRFEIILKWIANKDFLSVLDIGPSFLSELLYRKVGNRLSLMGFDEENSLGGHLASIDLLKKTNFLKQDLNFLVAKEVSQKFDLIICGEVMEHLYTSPKLLFKNLAQLLNPKGCLIIQTPNAVSLRKRIALVVGKNPFEIPRENLKNPGHYREYTTTELKSLATESGFKIEKLILDEYFEYPSLTSKIYRTFKKLIPRNLRSGITIILTKN